MVQENIELIKTGRGLAGSRVALIFAPKHATPGSLVALTDFLNRQEGIRAVPGYHGPNNNHVLRVVGISDDASFLRLLKEDFPRWQQEMDRIHSEPRIRIAPEANCEPLEEVEHFPHQPALQRIIKENANTFSGLAYMAGSLSLLLAAWRAPRNMPGQPKHDWFRVYTAGAYFSAAAVLVALSQKMDNPRDVYSILESVYPPLIKASREDRVAAEDQTQQILQFIRKHPWEISMLLNSSGSTAHAISAWKRGRTTELVAAIATLTACASSAMIPEKGGSSMLPLGDWLQDKEGRGPIKQLEEFAEHHPNARGLVSSMVKWMDWIQDNPLKLSSYVSGAANLGYIAAATEQKNPALAGMSMAYLVGNYTQSQATKGRGDGFDSVVSAAARIMAHDPNYRDVSPVELEKRIGRLAEKLSQQREILHPEDRLRRGIRARLAREAMQGELQGDDILTGFLPTEKHLLKRSPFVLPNHVQRAVADPELAQAASR